MVARCINTILTFLAVEKLISMLTITYSGNNLPIHSMRSNIIHAIEHWEAVMNIGASNYEHTHKHNIDTVYITFNSSLLSR